MNSLILNNSNNQNLLIFGNAEINKSNPQKIFQNHETTQKPQKKITKKTCLLTDKSKEIQNRSGSLWKCEDCQPDIYGGNIYRFKLKEEFDDITQNPDFHIKKQAIRKKNKEIYPAVEGARTSLLFLDPSIEKEEMVNQTIESIIDEYVEDYIENNNFNVNDLDIENYKQLLTQTISSDKSFIDTMLSNKTSLRTLGYEIRVKPDGVFLYLPDQEALLYRWAKLKEERPELPPLDIVLSDGIATDLEFVETYLKHDGLLSTGKEFVHDNLVHLISILADMLSVEKSTESTYPENKKKIIKSINNIYQKILFAKNTYSDKNSIQKLRRLEAVLGILVDRIFSESLKKNTTNLEKQFTKITFSIWTDPSWGPYLKKRFKDQKITPIEIQSFWLTISRN